MQLGKCFRHGPGDDNAGVQRGEAGWWMKRFRSAVLALCGMLAAGTALAQHQGNREQGGQRHFGPAGGRPGPVQRGAPPPPPSGTLTKEERQALNRDLNQANREIDRQGGGRR